MLKIATALTGENYELLSVDTPASKKKVVAMALALMIPTLIWVINGFMLTYVVLQSALAVSLLTAFVCGLIVFTIEKLIIMANGNKGLKRIRIAIGLIVAVLGSIAIDEVVFQDDIDISVKRLKNEAITDAKTTETESFKLANGYTKLEKDIERAQIAFDTAESVAIGETDGSNGTGDRGYGDVAKFKDRKALERKADVERLTTKKNLLESKMSKSVDKAGADVDSSFNQHALLIRIKALMNLVFSDLYMGITYTLFTLLMFFFEFLVVILKSTWDKTNYENRIEMIEEIGARRMQLLNNTKHPVYDGGLYLKEFSSVRKSIDKKEGIFV